MKKILALIFALICNAAVGQPPISNLKIYYINGIQNTRQLAEASAMTLTAKLSSLTGGVIVKSIYNPIGFYGGDLNPSGNPEGCTTYEPDVAQFIRFQLDQPTVQLAAVSTLSVVTRTGPTAIQSTGCIAADLGELAISKKNEENYATNYQSFVIGNDSSTYAAKYATGIPANAFMFFQNYFSKESPSIIKPVTDLVNEVIKVANEGNMVLIVAHSQGNLIANLAWVQLQIYLDEAKLKKIRILNVANTSRFSPHGYDITHNNDKEIFVNLKGLGGATLRKTAECFPITPTPFTSCSFRTVSPTFASSPFSFNGSWDSHNFINTYLSDKPLVRQSDGQNFTFSSAMLDSANNLLRGMGAFSNGTSIIPITQACLATIPPSGTLPYLSVVCVDNGQCPAGQVLQLIGGNNSATPPIPRISSCVIR